jgi:thioredoxin 1
MSAPKIISVSEDNFEQEVLKSPVPVLVDFWAEWCGPCKMIVPILDDLADEYDGKVKIAKVNVDDNQGLASRYGVTAIPTLLFFKDGDVVDQVRGFRSRRDLKESFDRVAV